MDNNGGGAGLILLVAIVIVCGIIFGLPALNRAADQAAADRERARADRAIADAEAAAIRSAANAEAAERRLVPILVTLCAVMVVAIVLSLVYMRLSEHKAITVARAHLPPPAPPVVNIIVLPDGSLSGPNGDLASRRRALQALNSPAVRNLLDQGK